MSGVSSPKRWSHPDTPGAVWTGDAPPGSAQVREWRRFNPGRWLYTPNPPRLDLGSGPRPAEGYVGVDITPSVSVLEWDFTSHHPWPFANESIEALHSSHCIEHLPTRLVAGRDALVRFMEEAYRIARPSAEFLLRWPAPFHPQTGQVMPRAWADPTHYRQIPIQQIKYFSLDYRRHEGVSYGWRCNWVMADQYFLRALSDDESLFEYQVTLHKEPMT